MNHFKTLIHTVFHIITQKSSQSITENFTLHCTVNQGRLKIRGRPIIGADIKHFYDYRYRPFSKQICR